MFIRSSKGIGTYLHFCGEIAEINGLQFLVTAESIIADDDRCARACDLEHNLLQYGVLFLHTHAQVALARVKVGRDFYIIRKHKPLHDRSEGRLVEREVLVELQREIGFVVMSLPVEVLKLGMELCRERELLGRRAVIV